jgi:hypothetical protein
MDKSLSATRDKLEFQQELLRILYTRDLANADLPFAHFFPIGHDKHRQQEAVEALKTLCLAPEKPTKPLRLGGSLDSIRKGIAENKRHEGKLRRIEAQYKSSAQATHVEYPTLTTPINKVFSFDLARYILTHRPDWPAWLPDVSEFAGGEPTTKAATPPPVPVIEEPSIIGVGQNEILIDKGQEVLFYKGKSHAGLFYKAINLLLGCGNSGINTASLYKGVYDAALPTKEMPQKQARKKLEALIKRLRTTFPKLLPERALNGTYHLNLNEYMFKIQPYTP